MVCLLPAGIHSVIVLFCRFFDRVSLALKRPNGKLSINKGLVYTGTLVLHQRGVQHKYLVLSNELTIVRKICKLSNDGECAFMIIRFAP